MNYKIITSQFVLMGSIALLLSCTGRSNTELQSSSSSSSSNVAAQAQAQLDAQLCNNISGRRYSSNRFKIITSAFGELASHTKIEFNNGAAILHSIDTTASPNTGGKIHFEAEKQSVTGEPTDSTLLLRSSGSQLSMSFDVKVAGEYKVVVHAGQEAAGQDASLMAVIVDGILVETVTVEAPSDTMQDYTIEISLQEARHTLTLEFTNDYYSGGDDRNLVLDWVDVFAKDGVDSVATTKTGTYSCANGKVNLQIPQRDIVPIEANANLSVITFNALGDGQLTFAQQNDMQSHLACSLVQGKRYANAEFAASNAPADLTLDLWFDSDTSKVQIDQLGTKINGYLDCDTDQLHVHSPSITETLILTTATIDESLAVKRGDSTVVLVPYQPGPGTEGDGDYTIGPNYQNSPDLDDTNVPKGRLYEYFMPSSQSAIYRGDDSTLNRQQAFNRRVRVYIPQQYVNGTKAPFIVAQDGYSGDLAKALNVLIQRKSIPPLVVIFVDNGGGDSLGSQRGLEYDTLSARYSRFITTEVLPAAEGLSDIRADYPDFALTTDPDGRGTYGCSSGGAAAFTMGWFTPDQFRRIITYSGTFVDQQDTDAAEEREYPWGAWEYHDRLIAAADTKPLRVFLHVSENDNDRNLPESSHHNWVVANKGMARELGKKDYHYRFIYSLGAGHCDGKVIRQTLPETLKWMWQDYLIKPASPF